MITITPHTERIITVLLVIIFVLFTLGYSSAPPFEGVDDALHFNYAKVIATTGKLPPRMEQSAQSFEFFQPPLYYLIPAALIHLTGDASDFHDLVLTQNNPAWASVNSPTGPVTRPYGSPQTANRYFHTAAEALPFPSSPSAQASYLIRLYGVLLGLLTVLWCKKTFDLVFPNHPDRRLLALGLVTLWPNLQYEFSLITNDVLGIALAALAVLLMLRIVKGFGTWRTYLLLGVVVGAALITKLSAAALGGPLLVLLIFRRDSIRHIMLTISGVVLVAGWWFIYGQIVYNDPLGLVGHSVQVPAVIVAPDRLSALDMANRMVSVYLRMWAFLGEHNAQIAAPPPVNLVFYVITFAAGVGGLFRLIQLYRAHQLNVRRVETQSMILLAAFGVTMLAAVFWFQTKAMYGNQPHHIYQGASIWGALVAFGLGPVLSVRWQVRQVLSFLSLMAALCALTLFGGFLPIYTVLPLPPIINYPLGYHYEGVAELIGTDRMDYVASPGDTLTITLYWQAVAPANRDDLQIIILGGKGSRIAYYGQPSHGMLSSGFWSHGLTWTETYSVEIPLDSPPGTYALLAGLYEPDPPRILRSTDASGRGAPWQIGTLVIEAAP